MYNITPDDKKKYMEAFLPHLIELRAKAGISQEDLAIVAGVSRQTYGTIERNMKDLSWNTFLSLLFFFDFNIHTHDMLHECGAFPDDFIKEISGKDTEKKLYLDRIFSGDEYDAIFAKLDEQAINSLKSMLMLEYARCTKLSGDEVVRAFDGVKFDLKNKNIIADQALGNIKSRKRNTK